MGNVNRWLKYAKAKLDATVKAGNERLDDLEARQAAEAHDRPWVAADGDAPTLDEARARIRWETEEAERQARARVAADDAARKAEVEAKRKADAPPASLTPAADGGPADAPAPADRAPVPDDPAQGATGSGTPADAPEAPAPAPRPEDDPLLGGILPATPEEAAARSAARLELEQRDRDAAARLEAIRKELGVDPPAGPAGPTG